MRGVAEASLANSFPASHPEQRAAYRAIYLGNDPAVHAELSLALARLEQTPADWGMIRAPVLVASKAHDFLWPPEIDRQVAAQIPGARFTVMNDAGHFPHLQAPGSLVGLAREVLPGTLRSTAVYIAEWASSIPGMEDMNGRGPNADPRWGSR
jgi:3-oxoadipate enol-lactonase